MPSRQGRVRMHWRGGCIAREGAHATPCCSVLALVRVRRAGCPARESVTACRGRSCRCGPAADRTPALQRGRTSLHEASSSGHAAVVQTLLQHGADVAARDAVGAAGVRVALRARVPACHVCVRHGMHGDVCTQSCASVLLCRGISAPVCIDGYLNVMPSRQGRVRMHWRGGCIAREGAHATPCCSVLALVRFRRAGCPARESVAACRGRSCRCVPAADRTPALQYGSTSLHFASESGHAAVVQTLLQHGANVAATNNVGAAGVPLALAWRSASECLHAMCVGAILHGDVCTQSCASVLLCRGSSAPVCIDGYVNAFPSGPCAHALAWRLHSTGGHPCDPLLHLRWCVSGEQGALRGRASPLSRPMKDPKASTAFIG